MAEPTSNPISFNPLRRAPIASRMLLWFLVVSAVPLVLLSHLYFVNFEQAVERQAVAQLGAIADRKSDQIEAYMAERIRDIGMLARTPGVADALFDFGEAFARHGTDSDEYRRVDWRFHRYLDHFRTTWNYHDIFLVTPAGDVVYTAVREADFATNLVSGPFRDSGLARVFENAQALLETEVSDYEFYLPSAERASFIAAPVIRDGRTLGVVALQMDNQAVFQVIHDDTGLGRSGITVVAVEEGGEARIVRAEQRGPVDEVEAVSSARGKKGPLYRSLRGERGQGVTLDHHGHRVVAAWRYLPSLRWGMTVEMSTEEAFAPVTEVRRAANAAFAVIFLLVVVAALYLARTIVRPIQGVIATTEAIAEGDLARRVEVEGDDEIGRLGRSFNRMTERVQRHTEALEAAERTISEARDRLEERVVERTAELEESNRRLAGEIDERSRAEGRLRLAAKVIDNTSEGVVITDADSRIVEVNDAYCRITGYGRDELIGRNPSTTSSGRHDAAFYREMWQRIQRDGHWSGEIWDRRKNGEIYPKLLTINAVYDDRGGLTHYVGVFSDISRIKATEEKLERLAYYDSLTGLPNRMLFRDRLNHEVAMARRHNTKMAVMFIDLDRFKYVNDTLGHSAGDRLLVEVAERLVDCVREADTVARLGGDEFVVILSDLSEGQWAGGVAQLVIDAVSRPVELEGQEVFVGASVGIGVWPDDGERSETLIKNADVAMYHAKEAGRGTFKFFTDAMNQDTARHLELEARLRRALERDELRLFYQPQVSLESGEVIGAEALVRWEDPERGMVSPGEFIPLAEETGLIVPMGEWVLREVCRQQVAWDAAGLPPLPVAVNLSPHQFRQEGLVERVTAILADNGLAPKRIELEITETAAMSDADSTIETLERFAAKGFKLAIDDFGTGYSSLAYLKRFPVDKLKIDRSFVMDIPSDANDAAIADSVIRLAHGLGLAVVAEGVETEAQREFLARRECDYMQGFLFSRPLPADEFEVLVRKTGP